MKRTQLVLGSFHILSSKCCYLVISANVQHGTWLGPKPAAACGTEAERALRGYRQVLCANSSTNLAELRLHRAGEPALDYPIAEGRVSVKGGGAACEALDVSSVFWY